MIKHEPQKIKIGWKKACIIIFKPKDKDMPKDEYLVASGIKNSDGVGIALLKDNSTTVQIKKDFKDTKAMIDWTKENVKKEDILVVHFRFATHGLKDEGNRHPFPIVGEEHKELLRETNINVDIAVVHNGVLSQYGSKEEKTFSDTQLFIMDILAKEVVKNNITDDTILKLVHEYIGTDKLLILKGDGTHILLGNYIEHEGCFYSNRTYEPVKEVKVEYLPYYHKWGNKTEWKTLKCTRCGENSQTVCTDEKTYVCSKCYFAEKNKLNYKNNESICEHCKELKVVKECKVGKDVYLMCKKCRREVSKGKINEKIMLEKLYGKQTQLDDETKSEEIECDNCGCSVLKKDTEVFYDQFFVCKECAKQMNDLENDEYVECDFCGEPMEIKDVRTTPISKKLICNHCAEMYENAGSQYPVRFEY